MSKLEVLNKALDELVDGNPDIKGALIVSPDGLVIAASLTFIDTQADVVAAMSAAFLGLAKRAIKTLKCGEFIEVVAEGSEMS
jgi:predicted regulator of Ras-like GTPase activity (Roadblock/LC7/MglB family)